MHTQPFRPRVARQSPLGVAAAAGLVAAGASATAIGQCSGSWISSPISATGFADGRVVALLQWDQDGPGGNPPVLVAAGSMTLSGTAAVTRVCRFDPAANAGAGAWVQLGAGLDGEVNVLTTASNGDLVAGGGFRNSGATPTAFVARFDGTSWQPYGSGMNTTVFALAQRPSSAAGGASGGAGQIFAGGWFTTAGGTGVNRVSRWTGTNWATVGSGPQIGMSDWVWDLKVLPSGDIVAGGAFNTATGVSTPKLARWNGTAWSGFGSGLVGGEVFEVFPLANGDVVVSGNITSAGGAPVRNVARWNSATATWLAMGEGFPQSCRGFELFNAAGGAGGSDIMAINVTPDGFSTQFLVRWTGTSWERLASLNSTIFATAALPNGDIAVGGSFSLADGIARNRIAVYRPGPSNNLPGPGILMQPQAARACLDGVAFMSVTPGAGAISGATSYAWQLETSPGVWTPMTTFVSALPGGGQGRAIPVPSAPPQVTYQILVTGRPGVINARVVITTPCASTTSSPAALTICTADFDCSGTRDVSDIFAFLAAWFAGDFRTDFNGMNGVDVGDIFAFLAAWFAGC